MVATQGMTAGSGFAATEKMLVMHDIVMSALKCHPSIVPLLFVDDLAVQAIGTLEHITEHMVGFIQKVCSRIAADGMELPTKKAIYTTSSCCHTRHRLAASELRF